MADVARRGIVFGATGYTGRATVAELRRRGVATYAHVRPDSPDLEKYRAEFAAHGAETDATPWEPAALSARLAELSPDLAFLLLGTTRKRAAQTGGADSYERVDYGLSAMAIDAARKAQRAPRIVYLSVMGVAGQRSGYVGARVRVEAHLRASGLPWIIARPSFITGKDRPEDRPGERFAATVSDGAGTLLAAVGLGRLRDSIHSLTAGALARALVSLALGEKANLIASSGELYRLGQL